MEGLRLFDMVEEILIKGETLSDFSCNMLNLAALLRHEKSIVVGSAVYEYFGAPYDAWFDGKVTKVSGGSPKLYTVKYSDSSNMESEEHEVRRWLKIHDTREWEQYNCGYASGAFTYLKNRVTDNCPAAFHYKDIYNMWKLSRIFNPAYAGQHLSHPRQFGLPQRHHALTLL